MLHSLREKLALLSPSEDKELFDKVFQHLLEVYPTGEDPWGLNLKKARKNLEYIWPIYKHYFKVRIFGKEHVEDKPYVVISNHTGQIAIDGMLICTAFTTEIEPPRVLRPMAERFFNAIPFLGSWAAEGGSVLGDRQNCLNLLERDQSVLVFPEGVRGVAKSTNKFYQQQDFTRGFFRMALTAKVDILPLAVVGAEEFYPLVYQAKGLAKILGLPALPISPTILPLPSPIDIHIGERYRVPDISPDTPDSELDNHIFAIEQKIKDLTTHGLENRREFWANIKKPKGKDS
jgi:1-acyl-sn-glycerol-3-phosphate acyltransferase